MNKSIEKKRVYNDTIIKELEEKYDITRDFILKSIRGDRVGRLSIKIAEDYNKADRAAKAVIRKKIEE